MTHDLDHCTGYLCPVRDKCLRYIAFTKVEEADMPYTWFVAAQYEDGHCINFLEKKNE